MSLVTGHALSLLLFRLHSGRLLGINLLKVNEIIACPPLTKLPNRHPNVRGIATLRGSAVTVIDLASAIGERGGSSEDDGCLIVTELSRSRQGLHVKNVERIVQCSTRDVRPPPAASGSRAFITGVTQIDGAIVQILDIEKVLHDIAPALDDAPGVRVAAQHTNMVFLDVTNGRVDAFRSHMEAAGVRVSVGYTPRVRLVLHRDVDDAALQRALDALRTFPA